MGLTYSTDQSQNEKYPRTADANKIKASNKTAVLNCSPTLTDQEKSSLGDAHTRVETGLLKLKLYKLLSVYTRDLLIQSGEYALIVCHELLKLEDAGLFSLATIEAIAKAPQHASTITFLLMELSKSKTLLDVSFATITLPALNRYSKFKMLSTAQDAVTLKAINAICDHCALPKNIMLNVVASFFKTRTTNVKRPKEEAEQKEDEHIVLKRSTITAFPFERLNQRHYPVTLAIRGTEMDNPSSKKFKR